MERQVRGSAEYLYPTGQSAEAAGSPRQKRPSGNTLRLIASALYAPGFSAPQGRFRPRPLFTSPESTYGSRYTVLRSGPGVLHGAARASVPEVASGRTTTSS